ncbi:alpha-glucosidase [Mobilisporobacter senegalensis]|uniref:Alpha-glucosidase n=1 Tax=Mobilisporobacter senegalensis TaxID=1329262 RepID=A0A3N1XG14_9FIRM|nr:glycoside hydrolase family 13 protein [Mobilisporobacter senegalensis]ROR25664.1 alpha-glucosidase [Mobilisporobacter senegalensis]
MNYDRSNEYLYIDDYRSPLNLRALFSDTSKEFCSAAYSGSTQLVAFRFRTGKDNVERVHIIINGVRQLMEKDSGDKLFDYYFLEIPQGKEEVNYYFEINSGEVIVFYNHMGASMELQSDYNFIFFPEFQIPKWAKGAVFYQIYVDRFFNGDPDNDVVDREYHYIGDKIKKVTDWNKYPDVMGVREFYGGDLLGVMNKLDYLQFLGIDAIYFNPIFVSPSNHKYDIQDYDYVDPHFGEIVTKEGNPLPQDEYNNGQASLYINRVTKKENLEASNKLFIRLVEEAHARGIKVILDGVFNHCGSFNKWLDRERIYEGQEGYEKGAYIHGDSPYRSYFKFREDKWPYNGSYDGWWGHDTLPKLNYEESERLYNYMMYIARKWVSPPFNADGWRLDVAADLGQSNEFNHIFWKDFRKNVKEANPNAIIIAEHYGNPNSWLKGDEWDTVMNYDAFMEPVSWFLTGMEKHSDEFKEDLLGNSEYFIWAMNHNMSKFGRASLEISMNEISNHDHSRFLTRTNGRAGRTNSLGPKAAEENVSKGILKEAVILQMTWPGAPTIYYGDEAGLCGWTDPDNRRTYPWGREDTDLINFHKDIIGIHKSFEALKTGALKFLAHQYNFISYGRFDHKDKIVAAINNNHHEITVTIPVWEIGIGDGENMVRLIKTNEIGYDLSEELYTVEGGKIVITMESVSGVILKI